ncbi:hypothetical protein LG201_08025 [Methylobacillus gramineus]|uniref:hypothetical protein n=1 Tax=Methylobacillus gramineus TaxID=755169 RepID=UPI001CFF8E2E|nr:hypothetical protein [Methylobacillus gramineus]MCB5185150.1 hypothetical protein [Methylobacillus gramineus]
MALLSTGDLQFTYSWTAIPPDDARVTGVPDSTLLNRGEGYEVLYFINRLATASEWASKEPALKAERLIKTKLPGDVRSHKNVWQWLIDHWND